MFLKPIRNFYGRFEHWISSLFLFLGFIFDVFTLKRVDTLFENILIVAYLLLIGIFITLIHIKEKKSDSDKDSTHSHFWHVNVLQFLFGGVFSAYLILYFRSADILVAWPFIALLVTIFIANEFLKQHYVRLSFQISLFFLSIYSFVIFLVPVIFRQIGPAIFLFSGFISLVLIAIFIKILFYFIKDKFTQSRKLIRFLILSIFLLMNVLYFTNLIPPIPLSLKDAGVYHSVEKNSDGDYEVTYEDYGWRKYFQLYEDFRVMPGGAVYAYSAIFSPKNLNLTVVHQWQYYHEEQNKWITESSIRLPVVGGRDGGFRTYSVRSGLAPGKWKVNIKTEQGQIIGHLRFNIITSDTKIELEKITK